MQPRRADRGRDAAPNNRTVKTARAPRGHVPAARLLPSQIVSDNLRQAPGPIRLSASRPVPGPPIRSPTAVPSLRFGAADRSATCPRTSLGAPVGFGFPNCSHAEPARREGQGCDTKSRAFPLHFPGRPQSRPISPLVIPSRPPGAGVEINRPFRRAGGPAALDLTCSGGQAAGRQSTPSVAVDSSHRLAPRS
jgi:hypothetical protein